MAGSTGGTHRQAQPVRQRHHTSAAAPQPLLLRLVAVLVGLVIVGTGGLSRIPVGIADIAAPAASVHRADITLTDSWSPYAAGSIGDAAAVPFPAATPTFDDSLHTLLDDMLGIGNKTLAELIVGNNPGLTIGQLLGMASDGATTVNTSLGIHDLLYLLGLDNINVADVMAALNLPVLVPGTSTPTTFDDILDRMHLSNVKLDQILTPLGIPHTQTLYGLVDRFSSVNETLGTLFQRVGPIGDPDTQSVQSALQSIGLGGYYSGWFTGCSIFSLGLCFLCSGVTGTVEDALNCITTEYSNADSQHPNITLSSHQTAAYLLTHIYQLQPGTTDADFSKPVGNYTIGQALGFDGTTTIKQFVDGPTGYEADPNHVGIWINMDVSTGQWQNGIVDGSPSGPSVVTNISGDPWRGYTDHIGNNYGGGQSAGQSGHTSTNVLPWNYHTSSSSPTPTTPEGSVVTVNTAPADGGEAPHHPPENNLPNNGGIFSHGGPDTPIAVTTEPLGTTAWGDLLSWFNLPPTESIADVISNFWVNDVQLGYYTVKDALMGMVTNPAALGSGLTDNTTVVSYLDSIGWGAMTLDQFLGLGP